MSVATVLDLAADHIERHGWWSRTKGSVLDGAANTISIVGGGSAEATPSRLAFAHYLGGVNSADIYAWNDAPERTPAEVIAALRACAVIEAAKESAPHPEAAKVGAL